MVVLLFTNTVRRGDSPGRYTRQPASSAAAEREETRRVLFMGDSCVVRKVAQKGREDARTGAPRVVR
jgi:hypothetical protein